MRSKLTVLALLFLLVLQAPACSDDGVAPDTDDPPRSFDEQHASFDFPVTIEGMEYILTYEGTHDVIEESDPDVRHVVFGHHGASRNSISYFNNVVGAYSSRPDRIAIERQTMVIAPAKIGQAHVDDYPERYADGHYPYWRAGWREGRRSENQPAISNFTLLDAMALHIVDQFPNVESIVFSGHSAGGQVMSRYAVGSQAHDELKERGIDVRYVISNPSSFLYLDRQRPDLDADEGVIDYSDEAPMVDGEPCESFNDYRYGLERNVARYMRHRPAQELVEDFRDREVFIFQGAEDNDPFASALDTRCQAMTQGRHRLERGLRYFDYLGEVYGSEVYESTFLEVVPGVGHSSSRMFSSSAGQEILFLDFL